MAKNKKSGAAFTLNSTPEEQALAATLSDMLPESLIPADGLAFNLLAAKVAEWVALNHTVRERGITQYSERSGVSHLSPEARREAEVFAEVIALCKEFGMTPRSRARMAAAVGADRDPAVSPVFRGFISTDPGKPAE